MMIALRRTGWQQQQRSTWWREIGAEVSQHSARAEDGKVSFQSTASTVQCSLLGATNATDRSLLVDHSRLVSRGISDSRPAEWQPKRRIVRLLVSCA